MPNEVLSEALREAYASAPADVVILNTLEIRHPSFVDEFGNATAIRVVRDFHNLRATLESNAPINAGEEVEFISYSFDINLPPVSDRSAPQADITIDNVSREIVKNIELAITSQQVIQMTYRPYLSTDLSAPHYDPPLHLILTNIAVNLHQITATARFGDFSNVSFPRELYTAKRFPGLIR